MKAVQSSQFPAYALVSSSRRVIPVRPRAQEALGRHTGKICSEWDSCSATIVALSSKRPQAMAQSAACRDLPLFIAVDENDVRLGVLLNEAVETR